MQRAGRDEDAVNSSHPSPPTISKPPSSHYGLPRTALILYGSETGNAEDLAHEVANLTTRLRFDTTVLDMDSATLRDVIKPTVVVFTLSTTGQGEFPQNARRFWKTLLSGALKAGALRKLCFASFGLGDSSYARFNVAHRMLYGRLVQLGAKVVWGRGEGNEQHPEGHSAGFREWIVGLKGALLDAFPLADGVEFIGDDVFLEPKWKLAFAEDRHPNGTHDESSKPPLPLANGVTHTDDEEEPPSRNPIPIIDAHDATVVSNTRITSPTHFQDVRLLDLHFSTRHHYRPGAVAVLYPKNFPSDVQSFINLMSWQHEADIPVTLLPTSDTSTAHPSPLRHLNLTSTPHTLRYLLTNVLDIMSIPRRTFFATLLHFLSPTNPDTPYQKERLVELADPTLIDELWDYTTRPKRTILEVLTDFTTVRIPPAYALAALPLMKPRQFSIASGGHFRRPEDGGEGTRVQLLVAIADPPSPIIKHRRRYGVCTRWVKTLQAGQELRVGLQEGYLDPRPEEVGRPVLMVAPGTGVAPMRSLVWQRVEWWGEQEQERRRMLDREGSDDGGATMPLVALAGSLLLTGSRGPDADWHFSDEYPLLTSTHGLTVLPAFSRSSDHPRRYVQDVIRENAAQVRDLLLEKEGSVYVCGSSGAMPKAVREAVVDVVAEGGMEREKAEEWVDTLEKRGGWRQETW